MRQASQSVICQVPKIPSSPKKAVCWAAAERGGMSAPPEKPPAFWLAWRTGYNFFWLSGVAVPADQLSTTDLLGGTATINTNGSVYLNGLQFGLESRW